MKRIFFQFVILAMAVGLTGGEYPLVKPPAKGNVCGKILKSHLVKKLSLLSRVTNKHFEPDLFNSKTGEFKFSNLEGDANYDLKLELKDGRVLEGIDLSFVDERLIRLAKLHRKSLGLADDPREKIIYNEEDTKKLFEFVRDMEDFMDKRRIIYISPDGPRATTLVELLRDRDFHQSKGSLVWRVELWYFVKEGGNWRKLPDQEKVLRRERLLKKDWNKIHVEYFPSLSIPITKNGTSEKVTVTIPDVPDTTKGKLVNRDFKANTKPRIISRQY